MLWVWDGTCGIGCAAQNMSHAQTKTNFRQIETPHLVTWWLRESVCEGGSWISGPAFPPDPTHVFSFTTCLSTAACFVSFPLWAKLRWSYSPQTSYKSHRSVSNMQWWWKTAETKGRLCLNGRTRRDAYSHCVEQNDEETFFYSSSLSFQERHSVLIRSACYIWRLQNKLPNTVQPFFIWLPLRLKSQTQTDWLLHCGENAWRRADECSLWRWFLFL